jgi:hypothetical protein
MKAITDEVEALLGQQDDISPRSAALLASELIAQVVGRDLGSHPESIDLTIQLRGDVVRMEATGPVAPSGVTGGDPNSTSDHLADWGVLILDRLADRWGVDGEPRRTIWAELVRNKALP